MHHRVRQALGEDLTRRHGLSTADYDALVTLSTQPGRQLRMATLAERILQPRSSVTRLVGSLEERGLVERIPTPDDGRGMSARLTPAGTALFRRAHRTHLREIRGRFLDHLAAEQLDQLACAWAAIDPTVFD